MNIKRINKLADFIESKRYKFDMTDGEVRPKCGSAGCIGGHAAVLWKGAGIGGPSRRGYDPDKLAKFLDLTDHKIKKLCEPHLLMPDITREGAVEALRNLAKTGRVRFKRSLLRRPE